MAIRGFGFRARCRSDVFDALGLATFAAALAFAPMPAAANNYAESAAWQFKTSTDRANEAAILDLIEKRRGGYYAAPIYNSYIAQQYNCGITRSRMTVSGNTTRADALANQAINLLTANCTGGDARGAVLTSTQMSVTGVTATAHTDAVYPARNPSVSDSLSTFTGNTTTALAGGNVADDGVELTGGNHPTSVPTVYAGRFHADVSAQAALLNSQSNLGAVTATAFNNSTPLNSPDAPVVNAAVAATDNLVSATTYGNLASNAANVSALGRLPTAAVANVQSNSEPITAQVIGASYGIRSGALTGSALTLSGNQLVAAATGNQATNIITSIR